MAEIGRSSLRIVSVDDHVIEPPNIWVDRLPAKYRDEGPRVERTRGRLGDEEDAIGVKASWQADPDGRQWDVWRYEDRVFPLGGIELGTENPFDHEPAVKRQLPVTFEDMRPGCYDVTARLDDMDLNGVEASLCFPNTVARFAGQTFLEAKDKDLALLCVQAYNDWMIDEWCAPSGGRLVPLCIIPLWDPQLAADEVRRTAARGNRAVTFTELPTWLGLPSIHNDHWDPFLEACEETRTVINVHIGSASKIFSTSDDAPIHTMSTLTFVNSAMSISDWILSAKLQKYPGLRLAFAECQIGWLPFLLERMDRSWRHLPNWGWANGLSAAESMPERPSYYFHKHMLCAFFEDAFGVQVIANVGVDNVAFETDYPHNDGTFPHSAKVLREALHGCDDETIRKVTRDNAIRFFDLTL